MGTGRQVVGRPVDGHRNRCIGKRLGQYTTPVIGALVKFFTSLVATARVGASQLDPLLSACYFSGSRPFPWRFFQTYQN